MRADVVRSVDASLQQQVPDAKAGVYLTRRDDAQEGETLDVDAYRPVPGA
jgi:hypothetical protein